MSIPSTDDKLFDKYCRKPFSFHLIFTMPNLLLINLTTHGERANVSMSSEACRQSQEGKKQFVLQR